MIERRFLYTVELYQYYKGSIGLNVMNVYPTADQLGRVEFGKVVAVSNPDSDGYFTVTFRQ